MVNGYRHSYALLKIKNRVLCWWDGLGINEDVSHIHFLSHECQTRSLYLLRWFGWQKSTQNALVLTVKSVFDINYKTQRSLIGILICAEVWVTVT